MFAQRNSDPRRLVKDIFLDDLDMPVDSVAKIVFEQTGASIPEEDIKRIQADASRAINRALPPRDLEPLPPKPASNTFANHPRLIVGGKQDPMKMAKKGRGLVDVDEKRNWLIKWADERGGQAIIKEAQKALIAQFGEGLGTSFVANTLKAARQKILDEKRAKSEGLTTGMLVENHPLVPVPATVQVHTEKLADSNAMLETVKSIANLMRVSQIKSISLDDEGRVSFEAKMSVSGFKPSDA